MLKNCLLAALLATVAAGCSKTKTDDTTPDVAESPGDTTAGEFLATADFASSGEVAVVGTAILTRKEDGIYLVLGDNFSADSTEDLKIGFGGEDGPDPATSIATLRSNSGAQEYKLPDKDFDPMDYQAIYVWTDDGTALGAATL